MEMIIGRVSVEMIMGLTSEELIMGRVGRDDNCIAHLVLSAFLTWLETELEKYKIWKF